MGIFDATTNSIFATYRARLIFRDRVMGGVPRDPKIIEAWIRSKAGIEREEEIRQATLRTLIERGADVRPDMTFEEMVAASSTVAGEQQTEGFKRDDNGLYLESRALKAMLKESVNILYAGEKWGKTRKGPRSFFAERVFVNPDHISLLRTEPDGVELLMGHVTGRMGPQSTLSYHEFVTRAEIEFQVLVLHDEVSESQWPEIWAHAQENGLGALRSQGFGRFDIEMWSQVPAVTSNGRAAVAVPA